MIGTMPRDLVVVSWLVPLLLKDLSRMPGIGSRPGARDVVTIAGEVGPTIVTMTSGSSLLGSRRSTDVMPGILLACGKQDMQNQMSHTLSEQPAMLRLFTMAWSEIRAELSH